MCLFAFVSSIFIILLTHSLVSVCLPLSNPRTHPHTQWKKRHRGIIEEHKASCAKGKKMLKTQISEGECNSGIQGVLEKTQLGNHM